MVSRCRLAARTLFWLSQQLSSNGLLLLVSVGAGASTRCRAESEVEWLHLTDLLLASSRVVSENMLRAGSANVNKDMVRSEME